LEPPDFPLALGVFRDVDRPTYDALLRSQIAAVIAQRGRGDLRRLLNGGTTWEVD
jgi:2-oxoglutarate ferredoxin oxidoreductase subunit beta